MTEVSQPDLAGLLREILQQQTAMLQLQRVLVERLLGGSSPPSEPAERSIAPTISTPQRAPAESESALAIAPSAAEPNLARGARYYQSRSSLTARSTAPDELELLRRLQEMRDASDLILQFGPYRGSTLAQVAISDPEYIRELTRGARRPEVRAAAGRLVQALDAAAEHKPKPHASTRRGRPAR
jgi:hypothetical protein